MVHTAIGLYITPERQFVDMLCTDQEFRRTLLMDWWSHSMVEWNDQVTTFRQFNTFWFISPDTKGFRARNYSGSCLKYRIHGSWFLFGGNRNSPCQFRKHFTECHNSAVRRQHAKSNRRRTIGRVSPCQRMTHSPCCSYMGHDNFFLNLLFMGNNHRLINIYGSFYRK
jgi:hypothetical protein